MIYLAELLIPGKSRRTGFQKFALSDDDLHRLLRGERPSFAEHAAFIQTLIDRPFDESLLPLRRLGCKMATGSGKTVVMAMLIAWAFCNRGINPASREFPWAALVCCPNLTVKERLQVLRPEVAGNYYEAFDIVPSKYASLLKIGKVLVTNWHAFAPESEHKEGDRNYAVVNKGPEPADIFARRVLGDLFDRLPLMVLNDEGHHCWRPAPLDDEEKLSRDEKQLLEDEVQEATIWVEGLDKLNNARGREPGIGLCVDLSATPFYIKGSGHPEGRPFPWLVVDGLEPLAITPEHVPTATFVRATVGYAEGTPGQVVTPFAFEEQDREEFYSQNHLQTIKFQIAQQILSDLLAAANGNDTSRQRVLRLQSRHQLFPQVYRFVDEYVGRKFDFNDAHPCELGLEKYFRRVVERIRDAIEPDEAEGVPPLLPVLNRWKPIGTTAEVDFKTTRPCHGTGRSHINQIVLDTHSWEQAAAFYLESSDAVCFYARNDRTGLVIPYEYEGIAHSDQPDYLIRLINSVTLILEIKGYEDDQTRAKHAAARRWVSAVNNWGQLGRWAFHVCRKPQALARELADVLQSLNSDNPEKLVDMAAASLVAPCDEGLFAAKNSAE